MTQAFTVIVAHGDEPIYARQANDTVAGDQITGLDRFGRVVDQRWLRTSGGITTTLDRFQYGYDPDGNVL